jgi:hypothetical protein
MMTRLFYDPTYAESWCQINLPVALQLDVKKFEKYAKEIQAPEFVQIYQEPQATIGTDLSKYAELPTEHPVTMTAEQFEAVEPIPF